MSAVDIVKTLLELTAVILLIIGLFNEKKLVDFEIKLKIWFRKFIIQLCAELSNHMENKNESEIEVYYQ